MEHFNKNMADRLKQLRAKNNLSLHQLSQKCGISRATLSRLENAEVSPTAAVLGKLCATYNITMSRLMAMVEANFTPLISKSNQEIWVDPETGYTRRMLSPPAEILSAEMLECFVPKGQNISYAAPPKQGLEHHLYMLEGALTLIIDSQTYQLKAGDCLRYQLYGASQFKTDKNISAKYILTIM